jgi:hypothetical protein
VGKGLLAGSCSRKCGMPAPSQPLNEVEGRKGLFGSCRCRPVAYAQELGFFALKGRSSVKVSVMTQAKRSRAQAHKNSDDESLDESEFSNSRAGPSVSRRFSNEVIRLVRPAPIARGTTAEADKMTQRRCILTVLGKAPPPPKPMVRGRGTAERKQHLGHNGRPPA